jgi:galactoside O-acetyltransferase
MIKANLRILSQLTSTCEVLKVLGATVGENTHIYSDVCVYNMKDWSCSNLSIGSNVYIGPRCVFDLTSKITIEDDAAISAQVTFVTHLDVGNQPLKEKVARTEGAITIKRGAWIGVNTSILQDVEIGEFAMVGAMSLVNKMIPPEVVAFGIPCRVIRRIQKRDGGS